MPADRAFGRVEKKLRKHGSILLPSKYFEEFQFVGEVRQHPTQWAIYDLKAFASDILKSKQTFLISRQHRLQISGIAFRASSNFSEAPEQFSIHERGKSSSSFSARSLECVPMNRIKTAEKRNVLRLLRLIGVNENHPAYAFYSDSRSLTPDDNEQPSGEESD